MSWLFLPERLVSLEPALLELEKRFHVHRLLNAGILDREGRGGDALKPKGWSGKGDDGHGHGVWQLDDRSHAAFLAEKLPSGRFKWEDPLVAGDYAMRMVLLPALRIFQGDMFLALCAWNSGPGAVKDALAKAPMHSRVVIHHRAADARTANGDYAEDVLYRMSCFAAGRDPYP